MAVSDNKLIKAARRFSTTLGVGGVANNSTTTIPLTTIPAVFSDGDAIEFIVDRVSTAGALTTTYEETIVGEVSGTNIINCARGVEGTAQAHSAGAVVEIKFTADMWNRMVAWGLVEHSQTGAHDATKVAMLAGTQTFTGAKTFDAAVTSKQVATPSNPSSGYNKLYFKNDNKLYKLTSAGTETEIGVSGGKYQFIVPGTLATGTNLAGVFFAPDALTITSVDMYVNTAGATGATTVDINKNNVSIFTTQGNRPSISDTGTSDTGNVPDVTSVAAGDKITIDVDAVTSQAPIDLYVVIKYS